MEQTPDTSVASTKRANQIVWTRKQLVALRFIIRFLGVCVILAFAGTVLATAKSVGHVVYPVWLQISWDTTNILLVPVAVIGTVCLFFISPRKRSTFRFWVEYILDFGLLGIGLYWGQLVGGLSVILLLYIGLTFVMVWGRIPDGFYDKNNPKEQRGNVSGDLVEGTSRL